MSPYFFHCANKWFFAKPTQKNDEGKAAPFTLILLKFAFFSVTCYLEHAHRQRANYREGLLV